MKIDGNVFTANSYNTIEGRDDKNKFNGDFSNIRTLSNEDLAGIFGYADVVFNVIYQKNSKEHAVLYESGAGPLKNESGLLDFKNSLYSLFNFKQDELIAIDGIAYNANEAGNYLWGMVLRKAGIMMNPKTIAELGTKGRSDEPHEQKAIQSVLIKRILINLTIKLKKLGLSHLSIIGMNIMNIRKMKKVRGYISRLIF